MDSLLEDRVSKAKKLAIKLLLCLYWGGPKPDRGVTFDTIESVKCWDKRVILVFEEWVRSNRPDNE